MQQMSAKPFGGQQSQYGQQPPRPQGFQQPKTAQPYSAWSQPGMSSLTMAKPPQYGQPSTPQQGGWGDAMPFRPQYGQPWGGPPQQSPWGGSQPSRPPGYVPMTMSFAPGTSDEYRQNAYGQQIAKDSARYQDQQRQSSQQAQQLQQMRDRFPGVDDDYLRRAMESDSQKKKQRALEDFDIQYGSNQARDSVLQRRSGEERYLQQREQDRQLTDNANNGGEQPVWDGSKYVLPSKSPIYGPEGQQAARQKQIADGQENQQRLIQRPQQASSWGRQSGSPSYGSPNSGRKLFEGGMAQSIQQPSQGTPYGMPMGGMPYGYGQQSPVDQSPVYQMGDQDIASRNAERMASNGGRNFMPTYYRDRDGQVRAAM